MTDQHEEALRAAARRYKRTQAAHEESRSVAADAVVAALKAGVEPTKVAELAPFTATYIRKLAREAGIPPAVKGKRAST